MSELLAFSAEQAAQLSGLSVHQIYRLDTTGVLKPTFADENRRRPFSRIYSFRDIVALRMIAVLRNEHRVPMQQLRRLGQWLTEHYEAPWSTLRFSVDRRQLYFTDPISGTRFAAEPMGQGVFSFYMSDVARDVEARADRLRNRSLEDIGRVTRNRNVAGGAWVVAGTRIPTSAIYDFHQAGYDTEGIIHQYSRLTPADIRAAIEHEEQSHRRRAS